MKIEAVCLALGLSWASGAALWADSITVDFPGASRFPVFDAGAAVDVVVAGERSSPAGEDTITWQVADYLGREVKAGRFNLPAGEPAFAQKFTLTGLPAGYFEVHARLSASGVSLPALGSRPKDIATFGLLSPLEILPLAKAGDSRFGIQGTTYLNSQAPGIRRGPAFNPYYKKLGIRWVNTNINWSLAEPDRPGQFAEKQAGKPFPRDFGSFTSGDFSPLICISEFPLWAVDFPPTFKRNPKNGHERQAFGPKDYALYKSYVKVRAQEMVTRNPGIAALYYKVGWEPDWHWKGTDQEFIRLFAETYAAIKEADPHAVVTGPSYALIDRGADELERLLPLGLAKALDGINIHGYFISRKGESGNPFNQHDDAGNEVGLRTPEHPKRIEGLRKIRALMKQYLKADAKLIQSEWGPSYWPYKLGEITPDIIRTQAAYNIRGHLLFLGEGCDVTYFFHATDHSGDLNTAGGTQGLSYNLDSQPTHGATVVSPKPNFMAAATLTRVLEGSTTVGPVDFKDPAIAAYAFKRAGQNVLAIWSKDNVTREIAVPTDSARVTIVDFMGNPAEVDCRDGRYKVTAGMYPQYIISGEKSK